MSCLALCLPWHGAQSSGSPWYPLLPCAGCCSVSASAGKRWAPLLAPPQTPRLGVLGSGGQGVPSGALCSPPLPHGLWAGLLIGAGWLVQPCSKAQREWKGRQGLGCSRAEARGMLSSGPLVPSCEWPGTLGLGCRCRAPGQKGRVELLGCRGPGDMGMRDGKALHALVPALPGCC